MTSVFAPPVRMSSRTAVRSEALCSARSRTLATTASLPFSGTTMVKGPLSEADKACSLHLAEPQGLTALAIGLASCSLEQAGYIEQERADDLSLSPLLRDDEPTDWLGWPRRRPRSIQGQRQAHQEREAIRHGFSYGLCRTGSAQSCHSSQCAVSVTRIT
jgi:hypothetical protein